MIMETRREHVPCQLAVRESMGLAQYAFAITNRHSTFTVLLHLKRKMVIFCSVGL